MASKKTAIPGWTPKCAGKAFLFAGKFGLIEQMESLVRSQGGNVLHDVSPTLDYVITAARSRGKPANVKTAEKLVTKNGAPIKIINEASFRYLFAPTQAEAVALLKAGPEGWAVWAFLREHGVRIPNLAGLDLAGVHVDEPHRVSFADMRIDGGRFSKATFARGTDFTNLYHVTLDDAQLPSSSL